MTLEQRVELTEKLLAAHAGRLFKLEQRVAVLTLAVSRTRRREELVAAEEGDD
jgi:hypothetical protein